MPRLSCVIPVVGHAHGLETTLVSVLEHFPDDCEIIVVHSAKYDDPYDLKSELRFIEAPAKTGYVGCANLGIQASRSPIVHLLAAGLEATGGWAEAAMARFADPKVAAVAPVVCNQFDSDEILAAGICYRAGGQAEVRKSLPPEKASADSSRAGSGFISDRPGGLLSPNRAEYFRRRVSDDRRQRACRGRIGIEPHARRLPIGVGTALQNRRFDEIVPRFARVWIRHGGRTAVLEKSADERLAGVDGDASVVGGARTDRQPVERRRDSATSRPHHRLCDARRLPRSP